MCVCCVLRAEGKTRRTRDLHLAEEEEEEEEETAPEKRLRLAKEYLAQLEEEGEMERVGSDGAKGEEQAATSGL